MPQGKQKHMEKKHWKNDPKRKRVGLHFCIMSYSYSLWVKWVDGHSGALRGTPFFDNELDKELGGFSCFFLGYILGCPRKLGNG